MSAKEMFEKLGYEQVETKVSIRYEKREIDKTTVFITEDLKEVKGRKLISRIEFEINQFGDKAITGAVYISPAEFKAIQQQVKELGWEWCGMSLEHYH